jgi:beta-1,2-mannobiose phosphorylase / 1,2-beta-oligomannan phosphorylase
MIARTGVLFLDRRNPRWVLYRSTRSVLEPRLATECEAVAPRVVFPTGVDARPDGALDVYYGVADSRIGVARACLADLLTPAHVRAA